MTPVPSPVFSVLASGASRMCPALDPRAVLLGVASGMRSQYGLAGVALTTRRDETAPPASLFRGRAAKTLCALGAVGESVTDKAPAAPSRLAAKGLLPRLASGALACAAVAGREGRGRDVPVAAATGAAAALGGALLGAAWRKSFSLCGAPDPLAAVAEDLSAALLVAFVCLSGPDGTTNIA
ncbi:hypothetical protein AB0J21_00845 [Streptomyces sp. NPDC049954]|uniref:hypothetical protein n=1 Tax=Streptomyces sp. NPDC049954 TaxID=3155779 RepID=UPI003447ED74